MRKIAVYDLEGHYLETIEAESIADVAKTLKIRRQAVGTQLTGQSNFAEIFQLREVLSSAPPSRIGDVSHLGLGVKRNPVHKHYKGKFIASYDNAHQAFLKTRVNEASIHACLKGARLTAGGCTWTYANKPDED